MTRISATRNLAQTVLERAALVAGVRSRLTPVSRAMVRVARKLRDESRRSTSLVASAATSLRIAALLATILSVGCAARSSRGHGTFQIKSVDSHWFIVPPTHSNLEQRAVVAIRDVSVNDRQQQSKPDGCTVHGRLFSLLSPHGKRGSWIFTAPSILDWTDDDELKLQWKQFIRSLEDLFVRGCFDSVAEYLGLKSMTENSFAFPLGDAMYFKYLSQEDGFVDLMPNMSVQVIRTRTIENSPLDISSTEVARYQVRLAKNGRTCFLQRSDGRSRSSFASYTFKQDDDLSVTFHNDEFLRLFFEGVEASRNMKRPALILGAHTVGDLSSAAAAVLESGRCTRLGQWNVDCTTFTELAAATPMLLVHVNGKPDDVPLGATVANVLNGLGANQRQAALSRLRIQRLFRNTYVEVSFSHSSELISRILLYAGDKLSW